MNGKSILIVEDDLDIRDFLTQFLTSEGFEVSCAENGKLALEMLSKKKPSVILLDLFMPVMDAVGFRKVQELDPQLSNIPIIVMSADWGLSVKAMNIGLSQYVRKPIDVESLLKAISSAIKN